MITFHLSGVDTATLGDETRTGSDPCRAMARDLVDAGAADQPWEMRREGRVAMYGPSLHWLAASVITETDNGLGRTWWKRHPNSPPRPVLEAVVERVRERARERKVARVGAL